MSIGHLSHGKGVRFELQVFFLGQTTSTGHGVNVLATVIVALRVCCAFIFVAR